MSLAISIKNLSKVYANGTEALKSINLNVVEGDFFALLGANGAGKTTLIGILTSLVSKTAGQAKVFGVDIDHDINAAKRMMGVVPQEMNFNQFEKTQDIIVTQAGYFGIPRDVALERSERLLKRLDLWGKKNQPSRNLSGGMKRRLMIARALVNEPRLLILDEPTAGVDVELRHSMWDFLRELNAAGTTILLTTHYLEEVEQMCRHAAMIKNGEIVAHDRVKVLLASVTHETFVIHVDRITSVDSIKGFNPICVDDQTIEVTLDKNKDLNNFISLLMKNGMTVQDLRPKGNRMEQLFLKLLEKQ